MRNLLFDSVKVDLAGAFNEYAVPMSLAQDEIVKLHSIDSELELGASGNLIRLYYNLQSVQADGGLSPDLEGALAGDRKTFWRNTFKATLTTSGVFYFQEKRQIYFDPPLVLVRAPRMVGLCSGTVSVYSFFYYTKEKISPSDLTKFMVKRHS